MVEFRKRLNDDDILAEINAMIIEYNKPDDPGPGGNDTGENSTDDSKETDPQENGPEIRGRLS